MTEVWIQVKSQRKCVTICFPMCISLCDVMTLTSPSVISTFISLCDVEIIYIFQNYIWVSEYELPKKVITCLEINVSNNQTSVESLHFQASVICFIWFLNWACHIINILSLLNWLRVKIVARESSYFSCFICIANIIRITNSKLSLTCHVQTLQTSQKPHLWLRFTELTITHHCYLFTGKRALSFQT